MTRIEGEKHLREKERNSEEASVLSEGQEEFQVRADSSSDASSSDVTDETQLLAATPLQLKSRIMQGDSEEGKKSSLQSVTSTSDCGQKDMEIESC